MSGGRETRNAGRWGRRDWAIPLAAGAGLTLAGGLVAGLADWGPEVRFGLVLTVGAVTLGLYGASVVARTPRASSSSGASRSDAEYRVGPGFGLGVASGERPETTAAPRPAQVIVVYGHPRSGKSRIARALIADHPEWALVSCGAFVRAEAARRGLPDDRATTDRLGQQLVDELGGDAFLAGVLAGAQLPDRTATLIVDDVYHVPVAEAIERRWDHLRFAKVDLPASVQGALERRADAGGSPLDRAADELERAHPPAVTVPGAPDDDAGGVQRGAGELSEFILRAA